MRTRIIFLYIICLLSSCIGGSGFVTKDHIFGNYYLVAPDDDIQLSLSYHEPVDGDNYGTFITETIFAVGYNEKYIIVKQHPNNNRTVTNYFILPLIKGFNWRTNNGLIGPLTLDQFNEKRKQLSIPDSLKFTIVKDNLK